MKGRRRVQQSPRDRLRAQVYRDWLGADLPVQADRNISRAGDTVDSLLSGLTISQGLSEQDLRDRWRDVAGDFIAEHTSPDSLRNGCLRLRVLQPAMRFHLEQSKLMLLDQLKRKVPEANITKLEFSYG